MDAIIQGLTLVVSFLRLVLFILGIKYFEYTNKSDGRVKVATVNKFILWLPTLPLQESLSGDFPLQLENTISIDQ